jgi:hypothetical protein
MNLMHASIWCHIMCDMSSNGFVYASKATYYGNESIVCHVFWKHVSCTTLSRCLHPSNDQQNRTCHTNPFKQAIHTHIIRSTMCSNHGRIHALHHQTLCIQKQNEHTNTQHKERCTRFNFTKVESCASPKNLIISRTNNYLKPCSH